MNHISGLDERLAGHTEILTQFKEETWTHTEDAYGISIQRNSEGH